MILEGFEIENWSCIRRVVVNDLPSTGVIVISGPNGIGKSSIVEALRACLMDSKSTSRSLGRGFPKNSSEKPRVQVTFRVNGTTWRITKQFNSKESRLESRTAPSHPWKLETADPSEAHERTRLLCGGTGSDSGLHQLLWLTQAEFKLPKKNDFDEDLKSQLRAVLGVLQTPLDNRFIGRVKDNWSRWFTARSKPKEKPQLKGACSLAKALEELSEVRTKLDEIEREFQRFESMANRSGDLEVVKRDLRRKLDEEMTACDLVQKEFEASHGRVQAHEHAKTKLAAANKAVADAEQLRTSRAAAEENVRVSEQLAVKAGLDAEEKSRLLAIAEDRLRDYQRDIQRKRETGRDLQNQLNAINEYKALLLNRTQLTTAQANFKKTERLIADLDKLSQQARERPAPDAEVLQKLENNRTNASTLRAELAAAAITLSMTPASESSLASVEIDGMATEPIHRQADGVVVRCLVRRRAEIAIPGWGEIELTRGSDTRSFDTIEENLKGMDAEFSKGLEPFGLAATDPTALDQLRSRAIEKKIREPELTRMQGEVSTLAPAGVEVLATIVSRLELQLQAKESGTIIPAISVAKLDSESERLTSEMTENNTAIEKLEKNLEDQTSEIEGKLESAGQKKRGKAEPETSRSLGLRRRTAEAKEQKASLDATLVLRREAENRIRTTEQIESGLQAANGELQKAQVEVATTTLDESEATVTERLSAAKETVRAVEKRLNTVSEEFIDLRGHLKASEGLHQRRAAAAVRVEELTRSTERESLESDAYNRLNTLFEECREKRLDIVMEPIAARVVRWMRLLRIGGYQSIRFNDQCLPETLSTVGGAVELALDDESKGTIEQIALMVRLALGSILSKDSEPVTAVLDDPLTHGDTVRLNLMRAVLRSAAAGESAAVPPAGPLQILVFTCHPERFEIDGARTIDLVKPEVLMRSF